MVTAQDYYSQILIMYEIKTEKVYGDFSNDKEMFDFSNHSTKSKNYDNSNKLVVGKMKDETAGSAIEEFAGLKSEMYSHLVNDNSEHKKAKGVNRNVVVAITHNDYINVLLNKKCLRHSMSRIQSKGHEIGTYEINKIFFCCFDYKIYIQNNGYDGFALGY